MSLEQSISEVAAAIRYFADKAYPSLLPRPKSLTIKLISERRENAMDLLTYEATFPAVPTGTDVQSQVFGVTVDGAAVQPDVELNAGITSQQFEVPQGVTVSLSLVYVDDAGNRSAARTQEFVAKDTIAPDAPGEFGEVKLVSERTIPDA